METNFEKFYEWFLSGVSSVKELRQKVNRELRKTVNPEFREVMIRVTTDWDFAEKLLGLDKPEMDLT